MKTQARPAQASSFNGYSSIVHRISTQIGVLLGCATVLAILPTAEAQLPSIQPNRVGIDPDRLATAHATVQRYVDANQHAGIITLLAREGRVVDVLTTGYRDLEKKLPMQRDTLCRIYSMSKAEGYWIRRIGGLNAASGKDLSQLL